MTRKIIKIETPQQKQEAHKYLIALGFTNVRGSGFSYPCFLVTDQDQKGFREWCEHWYRDHEVNCTLEDLRVSVQIKPYLNQVEASIREVT
ncbi:hypothetical protein [Acinetobacter ursingii]|uniref:hypothetical protein n=1 Tax=Acinetobacter ursingii TaxID=108980 RepID=UPI00124C97F4|nr:hypothetical protein [Acinetobacter ursingii]